MNDDEAPEIAKAPKWHCVTCPRPTALRFRWQTYKTGERHVRMECADCGRFIRYAPKTDFVLSLAEDRP